MNKFFSFHFFLYVRKTPHGRPGEIKIKYVIQKEHHMILTV